VIPESFDGAGWSPARRTGEFVSQKGKPRRIDQRRSGVSGDGC
jgi:hypothetical protein